jgi:CRISPR-associated protein Cmr4
MPNTSDLYLLTAITNLHAGSGEGDFSIVDKQVQRDPITSLPCIHASGIKGSLREAIEPPQQPASIDILTLFGSQVKPDNPSQKSTQGLYQYFDAKLLVLPIRSSHALFFRATCPAAIRQMLHDDEIYGKNLPNNTRTNLEELAAISVLEGSPIVFETVPSGHRLEVFQTSTKQTVLSQEVIDLLGSRVALLHVDDFKKLAESLPIIARNQLENGISANLWYEEVVPRESRFYFHVIHPENDTLLEDALTNLNDRVQIGANATVGYGLCTLSKIPKNA